MPQRPTETFKLGHYPLLRETNALNRVPCGEGMLMAKYRVGLRLQPRSWPYPAVGVLHKTGDSRLASKVIRSLTSTTNR